MDGNETMNRNASDCARILKALGEESRLQMVRLLLQGEKNVSEIVEFLKMPQPQVSHHLSILRSVGILDTRREGNRIYNFIKADVVSALRKNSKGLELGCCSIQFDATEYLPA